MYIKMRNEMVTIYTLFDSGLNVWEIVMTLQIYVGKIQFFRYLSDIDILSYLSNQARQ